jgi:hypothetical protein
MHQELKGFVFVYSPKGAEQEPVPLGWVVCVCCCPAKISETAIVFAAQTIAAFRNQCRNRSRSRLAGWGGQLFLLLPGIDFGSRNGGCEQTGGAGPL